MHLPRPVILIGLGLLSKFGFFYFFWVLEFLGLDPPHEGVLCAWCLVCGSFYGVSSVFLTIGCLTLLSWSRMGGLGCGALCLGCCCLFVCLFWSGGGPVGCLYEPRPSSCFLLVVQRCFNEHLTIRPCCFCCFCLLFLSLQASSCFGHLG